MIKMLTVVGARPQFVKAAAISRAIRQKFQSKIKEVILHTGQHYDSAMSQIFFEELELPKEDYNLQVGSGSHAVQTAAIMIGLEEIMLKENPDCVLLYGDTNSTLAAAITASKIHLPIIHVEGGVRFYKKKYPEEVNRLICDHLSTLIFVPTQTGVNSLKREGFALDNDPPYSEDNPKVYYCGDIMYDNSLLLSSVAEKKSLVLDRLNLKDKKFGLVTMHRPSNVDDPETLGELLKALVRVSEANQLTLVMPMHPRTLKIYSEKVEVDVKAMIERNSWLKMIPAVSFLDMTALEMRAEIIFTDSGGVQKEAYYFKKPCVILLDETPWVELEQSGSALLTGSDPMKIEEAYKTLMRKKSDVTYPPLFGDGKASFFICEKIVENFSKPE